MIVDMPVLYPHVKSGKLRGVAITAEKRAALLPDLATSVEQGLPGLIAWPSSEPVFDATLVGAERPAWTPHADPRIEALAGAYVDTEREAFRIALDVSAYSFVALAREMGATLSPGAELGNTFDQANHGVGTTWHDSGTLFMGSDPGASVTDVNGHFHHISNAACVDQALFPTVGSANPVLTGLCLARKVAETIGKRFTSEPELTPAQIAQEEPITVGRY